MTILDEFQDVFNTEKGREACKSPDWSHAFAWLANQPPSPKEQLIIKAVDAFDKAVEDYEPSDEELRVEYELQRFVDGNP